MIPWEEGTRGPLKKAELEYHKNIRVLSKRFELFIKTKRFDFEIS